MITKKFLRGAASVLKPGGRLDGFLRRQRQRARCLCGAAAGDAAEALARIFPQDAAAVFFLRAGGLRKVAAEIWFQNPKKSRKTCAERRGYGRGRFRDVVADDMDSVTSSACRKMCARNSSPPSLQRYVAKHPLDADGNSSRQNGAAGD
jgi:hypothetical protein